MAEISIRQWIENYNSGKYDSQDVKVQCEAGWYDWFCRDESLCGKTKRLAPKVKQLAKSSKVDVDNWYVWFKNNCPVFGSLYDDIRFADIKTGDVTYAKEKNIRFMMNLSVSPKTQKMQIVLQK